MRRYDEISTDRLLLRRWRDTDRDAFASLNADPAVMEHFPALLSRAESDAFVDRVEQHFEEHGYGFWVVQVDGRLAGFTGLSWTGIVGGEDLEVGWRLARWAWGHGYATEAARAALAVGLRHADSVVSFTALVNERSWRVMERLGMRRVSVFEHPRIAPGHPLRPHYLYRVP